MTKDDTDSKGSGPEPTRIDLGDDLIENTAIIPGHSASAESVDTGVSVAPATAEEQVQSARAYLIEGFHEDAKKILRQVLLTDAENAGARKLLEEIHEAELKQMFGSSEPVPRKSLFDTYDDSILDADSDEIVRLLDRDMGLGSLPPIELSLFNDAKLLSEFSVKLDREIGDSPRDRVDLAIGFMEMGLHAVAVRLLQPLTTSSDPSEQLNACALTAYSHICSDGPYRAISILQPVLNDNDIDRSRKTESFYLMGRALQLLSSHEEAIGWYLQSQENEANYRDCADRISRCRTALAEKK